MENLGSNGLPQQKERRHCLAPHTTHPAQAAQEGRHLTPASSADSAPVLARDRTVTLYRMQGLRGLNSTWPEQLVNVPPRATLTLRHFASP